MLDKLIDWWKTVRNRFLWEGNEREHKDPWRMGTIKDQEWRGQGTYSINVD